ncbi:4256_t:CDS:2 [Scutellospora calospora]|uniref:4256_t:CDS:1 n=1 Tax=Scutellospora calospora TaxID=85575 RepID=A0ACA9M853_9GLOM|nr:4256_t:CDS:2 [Scutellospora calospora]
MYTNAATTSDADQEASQYIGYDERENPSYYGFLTFHRDVVITSVFSQRWRDLDNYWADNFLKEAKKLFLDRKIYLKLKKKEESVMYLPLLLNKNRTLTSLLFSQQVESDRNRGSLPKYWKNIIREREKENRSASNKLKEKSKKRKRTVKTEFELLTTTPPPIYYPDLDKSTTTTKSSTARTPSPVKLWDSFLEEANLYQFDDNIKKYPRPTFKSYNKPYDISNEEDVRGALKNNIFDNIHIITTSRQPIEVFKRISKDDNVIGEPDFIYGRIGKLLLPIEVKTFWILYLEGNESLHERYEEDLKRERSETIPLGSSCKVSVVDIIRQIFGYLVANRLQYGILTTYNQHWFLKRPKNEPRALYISPTIEIESKNPAIFQCYAYIQYLSRIGSKSPSPGATPPSSPRFDYYESSDDITSGSDYEETIKTKLKRKRGNNSTKKD